MFSLLLKDLISDFYFTWILKENCCWNFEKIKPEYDGRFLFTNKADIKKLRLVKINKGTSAAELTGMLKDSVKPTLWRKDNSQEKMEYFQ